VFEVLEPALCNNISSPTEELLLFQLIIPEYILLESIICTIYVPTSRNSVIPVFVQSLVTDKDLDTVITPLLVRLEANSSIDTLVITLDSVLLSIFVTNTDAMLIFDCYVIL
jgi:hypothetical protein